MRLNMKTTWTKTFCLHFVTLHCSYTCTSSNLFAQLVLCFYNLLHIAIYRLKMTYRIKLLTGLMKVQENI